MQLVNMKVLLQAEWQQLLEKFKMMYSKNAARKILKRSKNYDLASKLSKNL